jgi:hypothetical protein
LDDSTAESCWGLSESMEVDLECSSPLAGRCPHNNRKLGRTRMIVVKY